MSLVYDRDADYETWAELRELELREAAWANRPPSFAEAARQATESIKALNVALGGEKK